MRMKVLGNIKVEIIPHRRMLRGFGKFTTYVMIDGVFYINEKAVEEMQQRFGGHLSTKEIAEDIFREARNENRGYTLWDELSRRHIKY